VKRGNIQRKQLNAIVVLILASFILSGCIRPKPDIEPTATGQVVVDFQPTPFPTQALPIATQPIQIPTQSSEGELLTDEQARIIQDAANQYFVLAGGFALPVAEGTFSAWNTLPIAPDMITSFTFNNPSGLPCVGVVAYRNEQPINVFTGGYHCATDLNAQGVAGQWLLGLNAYPVLAIGGRITAPNITVVTVEYVATPMVPEPLTPNGNFFLIHPDFVNSATIINILDQSGANIGVLAVPLNPQG
jgi:hypothetical protein